VIGMIDGVDLVLRQTLVTAIPSLSSRVGFQPPDDTWRQRVGAGTGVWLNCALVDLREDRHRRSTDIRVEQDPLRRIYPPYLLRCHYLLSAWNSAKESEAVPAVMQEHALLGQVIAALVEQGPLTPATVLLPTELSTLPPPWQEVAFDTDILPPEGFPKIAEFWGTMGRAAPWRPVAWVAITVPVQPLPSEVDGVVTTAIVSTAAATGAAAPVETLLAVDGIVLDGSGPNAASPVPVHNAYVAFADAAGHLQARALSDTDGRFVVDGMPPGTYAVSARAAAHTPLGPVPVTVPSPTPGPVQLTFT
jgi:hypothetical protein